MLAAAQLGLLAACVVLFVPMGLAGWHLSRNKMLFFSGALFITLAVGVHLAPYFPILLLPSPSPPPSCLPFLHDVFFHPPEAATGGGVFSWPRSACSFQRLARSDASDLLNGSWILIAGDSQARLFTLALLRLLLDDTSLPPVESALFRRHSDYQILIPGSSTKVDFIWAPFETNLTDSVLRELTVSRRYPDVLVMGTGLWHMLHYTNATRYTESLSAVRRSAEGLLPELGAAPVVHMFWLGMPTLVNSMLNSEEKRERMGRAMWEAYERGVDKSKMLRRAGGPLRLLDVGLLSGRCGSRCTEDGMHYDEVVYEAALHIMLNALLIESQQRI